MQAIALPVWRRIRRGQTRDTDDTKLGRHDIGEILKRLMVRGWLFIIFRREDQMRAAYLLGVITTALMIAGAVGWATSPTSARLASPVGGQIDPLQLTLSAKNLPSQKYEDFSVVFN